MQKNQVKQLVARYLCGQAARKGVIEKVENVRTRRQADTSA